MLSLGTHTVSVTVVETMVNPEALVEKAARVMGRAFGGATVTEQKGSWVKPDGRLEYERGWRVTSYIGDTDPEKARALVLSLARNLKRTTARHGHPQDAVFVTDGPEAFLV